MKRNFKEGGYGKLGLDMYLFKTKSNESLDGKEEIFYWRKAN